MLPAYVCCSSILLGFFQLPDVTKAKAPERALPGIPSLEHALIPVQLAGSIVREEMLADHLLQAQQKYGFNSALAVRKREELVATRVRIERLRLEIEKSGDERLRTNAETKIAASLKHYREGLTMTTPELFARAKRDQEAVDRLCEELDRSHPERLNQLLAEYGLQHLMKDVKPQPAPRGK